MRLPPGKARLRRRILPIDPSARRIELLDAEVFGAPDIRQALAGRDPDERAFLALVMCSAEIDNGGFEQLFGNSSDDIAHHGAEGAERLGLSKHATMASDRSRAR